MRILTTILLVALISSTSFSQSIYGYMGKRFYVSGTFSGGPSIFSRNLEGEMAVLKFNIIGTLSANLVLNKKQAMAINYKRYSSVASVHSEGLGLIARQGLLFGGESSNSWDIGDFRFSTNEIGWNYQFFGKNLDAPIGSYISLGFGFAMSKYNVPFQTLNVSSTSSNSDYRILQFDNSTVIKSPILRFGLGRQSIFWNRFLFDVGVDVGLNLAFISSQFGNISPLGSSSGSNTSNGSVLTQEEFDRVSKKAVQNRVFMMNLINFRMGISYLLF